MKNREKYPNTDDALKAFEKHNKVCDCGCSFEEWLDKEAPSGLNAAIAGVLLGSLLGEIIIGAKGKPADKENKEPSNNDDKLTDTECPICHGKSGKIRHDLVPYFTCPACGSYIGASEGFANKEPNLHRDTKVFKSFIADLCTKNNAKTK